MQLDATWKLRQAARDKALSRGEEIAQLQGFRTHPVDPFEVIREEGDQILAEGADFGECFDGRLSFHGERFLLVYNTRYNNWSRGSDVHPKVRFTVAHELGHYFIDHHRQSLVLRQKPHGSTSEFESQAQVEREADAFAAGLLMPRYLLAPRVNRELDSSVSSIKEAASAFAVSLTSMMVRWTQLSHFPCATLCVRDGRIQWGFVSESFRSCGLWRARRGESPLSKHAKQFMGADPSFGSYRESAGTGRADAWLAGECEAIDVKEFVVAIPYSRCMMVFLSADEADIPEVFVNDD